MSDFPKKYHKICKEFKDMGSVLNDYRYNGMGSLAVGLSFLVSDCGIAVTQDSDFNKIEDLAGYFKGLSEMLTEKEEKEVTVGTLRGIDHNDLTTTLNNHGQYLSEGRVEPKGEISLGKITGFDFRPFTLHDLVLKNLVLVDCIFDHATLIDVEVKGVTLINCSMVGMEIYDSSIIDTSIGSSNISGCFIEGTDVTNTLLSECEIGGLEMEDCDLDSVRVRYCKTESKGGEV